MNDDQQGETRAYALREFAFAFPELSHRIPAVFGEDSFYAFEGILAQAILAGLREPADEELLGRAFSLLENVAAHTHPRPAGLVRVTLEVVHGVAQEDLFLIDEARRRMGAHTVLESDRALQFLSENGPPYFKAYLAARSAGD